MNSFDSVVAKFPQAIREKYDFSSAVYTGALQRIAGVLCPQHGAFSQYAAQFRKGRGCPQCGAEVRVQKRRTPQEEYFSAVSEIHNGKYDYSQTVFTGMNASINVRCPEHGVFLITANHHYYRKQGCGACATTARRERIVKYRHLSSASKVANTASSFFDRCWTAHDGRYEYPTQDYTGPKHKIRIVCPVHGEFQQAAWAHLSGKGCFQCGAADPKWERELIDFFTGLGFPIVRNAPVLDGKHIDVYLPERKFGVEMHGLHWHTEKKRGATYHREKWELANKHGIRLLQVFEDEWRDKREIVQNRIAAMLGFGPKYDARKCEVRVCGSEAITFLNRHHIQGAGRATLYYGLFCADELLAVASFARARSGAMVTGDTPDWEVIRYASLGRVRGGFGKLFKRFLSDVPSSRVVSYCDLRYGDGRLYAATGFVLDTVTPPDYWWVPDGKVVRIPRYETQKHKLEKHPVLCAFWKPELTERQVCEAAGWSRLFGVGHQKWAYTSIDTPTPT